MTDTRSVTLERTYPASAEQIWRAWTDTDVLRRWYGCSPDQLWTIHEWDVQLGGGLRVSMDFDGVPFEVHGEFLEVDRPHRLRFSFGDEQVITVTISDRDSGAVVTVFHDGLPTDEMRGIVTDGWTSSLTGLAAAAG